MVVGGGVISSLEVSDVWSVVRGGYLQIIFSSEVGSILVEESPSSNFQLKVGGDTGCLPPMFSSRRKVVRGGVPL